jgi:acyl-coenzyme A thioesterase PaaI-like protein
LSMEFKVNLLRPAAGKRFVVEARVIKAGGTLTVTRCERRTVRARKMLATMLGTMIRRTES